MIEIAYDFKSRDITLKNTTLARIAKYFNDEHVRFVRAVVLVHRRTVLEILTKIILTCPVDTGRLRGSFTPYMDKLGQSNRYTAILQRRSELQGSTKTPRSGFDPKAFQEGKQLGEYVDEALSTTIATNVDYAVKVERALGFLAAALIWGNNRYNRNMERMFDAAVKQGMIPNEDDSSVDINLEESVD